MMYLLEMIKADIVTGTKFQLGVIRQGHKYHDDPNNDGARKVGSRETGILVRDEEALKHYPVLVSVNHSVNRVQANNI